MTKEVREAFIAIRKEAGLTIDPATAEVHWSYEQTLDPYGINPDLPVEGGQVGREYFARSPDSEIWVWFGDLPNATRDALWEKHQRELAFPAGLPLLWPPVREQGRERMPGLTQDQREACYGARQMLVGFIQVLYPAETAHRLIGATIRAAFMEMCEQVAEHGNLDDLIKGLNEDLAEVGLEIQSRSRAKGWRP